MFIQSFKITEIVINEHNPLKLRYIRHLSLQGLLESWLGQ